MSDEPATMPCTHCDNGTVVVRDGRGKETHHLRCTYCQGTGRVVVEPDAALGFIEWWADPDANAIYYRHVGCDTPHRRWMVPLDDCPLPSEETEECSHCCLVRPLRARETEAEPLPAGWVRF